MLNLTQHNATQEQLDAGVTEPDNKAAVQELLTFEELPTMLEIEQRARQLVQLARDAGADEALIGGAPFFMSALEVALSLHGVRAFYAFSKREAVDQPQADGSVRKVQVFRHNGFVPACQWHPVYDGYHGASVQGWYPAP